MNRSTSHPAFYAILPAPLVCKLLLFAPVPAVLAAPIHHFDPAVVWSDASAVFGLDSGDLLLTHAGPEVAALDSTGAVYLLVPQPGFWDGELIVDDDDASYGMFARPTVAVGDLLASSEGAEVAIMSGTHLNVARLAAGGVWSYETIFSSDGWVGHAWGVRTGDYLPSLPGEEIFLIYEGILDTSHGRVCYRQDQTWAIDLVYHAEVGMDSAAGEFDPTHTGPEMVITTEMGPTYLLCETGTPPYEYWPHIMIWNDYENAGWVCVIADVDESHAGNEVVYGTRYSNSILVSRPADYGHQVDLIFTGLNDQPPRNMWDIATGDVLTGGVQEIVAVDNSGRVYLIWREEGQWHGETIWIDTAGPVYAVVVDDFDPIVTGDEILVAGDTGDLTLLVLDDVSAIGQTEEWVASLRSSLTCAPNPFNPRTTISYELPWDMTVDLRIFDCAGRLVSILLDRAEQSAGAHTAVWTGRDLHGRTVPSGTFSYRLVAGGYVATKTVTLIR